MASDYFLQNPPAISNTFENDPLLQSLLKRHLEKSQWNEISADLAKFGARCSCELLNWAEDAEANNPVHIPFDGWGHRIDEIKVSEGWKQLDRVSAEEGIVAIGYERRYGQFSRLYQFAKIFMYHPSSAYYTCPLAMTDGAAKLIENHGTNELKKRAFTRLTSRKPDEFWTSGQWMTETTGGSDVSNTETTAVKQSDGSYKLHGKKWFTSATTSQMAMTLARISDDKGNSIAGNKGLSLFYLELRDSENKLQNIEILRLKNKLGTKALPTAELMLNGTPAQLVGEVGTGVKTIATLFNITRIYNACTTMGAWKRLMDLARDYARKRSAFGKKLDQLPLHTRMLSQLELEYQGCFHLAMYTTLCLGKYECGNDENTGKLLRLLTPLAKLYCAKKNMLATSELIESFGGAGYIEDTGLPRWLRDNQTLCIWEGTTNVLSLDMLRALIKEDAWPVFAKEVKMKLDSVHDASLSGARNKVLTEFEKLNNFCATALTMEREVLEVHARDFAFSICNIMAATLLLEHAEETSEERYRLVANSFCDRTLHEVQSVSSSNISDFTRIIFP